MNQRNMLLLLRFLLSNNCYVVVILPMLSANGLTQREILSGISFGIMCQVLGDILFSYVTDKFGPKKTIFISSIVQIISMISLPFVYTMNEFLFIEVLIGLSTPAVSGAASKWLKLASEHFPYSEKANQSFYWGAHFFGGIVGCALFQFPKVVCFLNAGFFVLGNIISFFLKDIFVQPEQNSKKIDFSLFRMPKHFFVPLMGYATLFGFVSFSSWLLRLYVFKFFLQTPLLFGIIQIIGSFIALIGSLIARKKINWVILAFIALSIDAVSLVFDLRTVIFVGIGLGLICRGGISVMAREKIFTPMAKTEPVAIANFYFESTAKLVQSGALKLFSFVF